MRAMRFAIAVLMLAVTAGQAEATLILGPAPDSVTVVYNDLRWAYVSPVAITNWGAYNTLLAPSDNGNDGWRYATDAELALRPDVSLFQALPGGAAAAVPYWNTAFIHVDADDYISGFVRSTPDGSTWETVYVKDLPPTVTPEPTSLALAGFAGIGMAVGAWRRRRQEKQGA